MAVIGVMCKGQVITELSHELNQHRRESDRIADDRVELVGSARGLAWRSAA